MLLGDPVGALNDDHARSNASWKKEGSMGRLIHYLHYGRFKASPSFSSVFSVLQLGTSKGSLLGLRKHSIRISA